MNIFANTQTTSLRRHTNPVSAQSQRILAFLMLSIVLHGMLIAIFPGMFKDSNIVSASSELEVYLVPGSTNDHNTDNRHTASTGITGYNLPAAARHTQITRHRTSQYDARHSLVTQVRTQSLIKQHHREVSPGRENAAKIATMKTHSASWLMPDPADSTIKHPGNNVQTTSRHTPEPAAVAALLRAALLQHFHYPVIARQNNWEGTVVLDVRVSADGKVDATELLKPSGYRILDRAAQHAANDIGKLPAARRFLAGQSLIFRIPVAYRLRH